MILPTTARRALDAQLDRLQREHVVELHLDDLAHLLSEPEHDPFAPSASPLRPGVEDLALTLTAARDLPDHLTVRVVLPAGAAPNLPPAQVEEAFRRRAASLASVSWRTAMATRSMGRRQLPLGLAISVIAAVVAYGAGYLAATVQSAAAIGVLLLIAGVAITVAWVFSWMVIESAVLDWRLAGREAVAYELLSSATVDLVVGGAPAGGDG